MIKLNPLDTLKYNNWLDRYESIYKTESTFEQRTECLICLRKGSQPHWVK